MTSTQNRLSVRQPLYIIVARALMSDIEAGRHEVGGLLPTEAELGKQFNVSRHTVREAIRRLVELGLVSTQAGVGTKVRARRMESHYALTAENPSDLFNYVRDVSLKLRHGEEVVADDALAKLLECPAGRTWLRLRGERFVVGEDSPIASSVIYVAASYRAAVEDLREPSQPLYVMIERRFGIVADEVRQEISAVALDDAQAAALGVPPGSPGLRILRKYYSAEGELFELAVNLHAANRFSYANTLKLRMAHEPGL